MHAMELGGNAPFLVLADADLGQTVAGAMVAKMRNGGEACTAANRFYVHASIAGEFGRRLASAMAALTVGPGLDAGVEVGPLVNEPGSPRASTSPWTGDPQCRSAPLGNDSNVDEVSTNIPRGSSALCA